MVETPPRPVTFEEFLGLPGEGKREWVAGSVIEVEPSNLDHDETRSFLEATFREYAIVTDSGTVTGEAYVQRLEASGRAPDVSFFRKVHGDRLKRTGADGPADLVVEVVSPSSRQTDRRDKFHEYEAAGIEEYWIVDPDRREAEFYRLTDGRYRSVMPDEEGRVHSSALPGFYLRVEWLWTRPSVLSVFRDFGRL